VVFNKHHLFYLLIAELSRDKPDADYSILKCFIMEQCPDKYLKCMDVKRPDL